MFTLPALTLAACILSANIFARIGFKLSFISSLISPKFGLALMAAANTVLSPIALALLLMPVVRLVVSTLTLATVSNSFVASFNATSL